MFSGLVIKAAVFCTLGQELMLQLQKDNLWKRGDNIFTVSARDRAHKGTNNIHAALMCSQLRESLVSLFHLGFFI